MTQQLLRECRKLLDCYQDKSPTGGDSQTQELIDKIDLATGALPPTIEELERALEEALLARRLKRPACPTYWVRAVLQTKLGHVTAKVAFGPEPKPTVRLVLPWEPGWNFSSREYAEALAIRAAGALEDQLVGASVTLHTEVIQED